jgi:hypothetical protein
MFSTSTVNLLIKALIGALMVLLIGVLSRTRNYYVAGLLPLFPTFALMAHYIVGSTRSTADLKATILFGMWAVVPYLSDQPVLAGRPPAADSGLTCRIRYLVHRSGRRRAVMAKAMTPPLPG